MTARVEHDPDVVLRLEPGGRRPLGQRVRDDRAKWAKAIKDFNVKAED